MASWSSRIQEPSLLLAHYPQTISFSLKATLWPNVPVRAPAITSEFQVEEKKVQRNAYLTKVVSLWGAFPEDSHDDFCLHPMTTSSSKGGWKMMPVTWHMAVSAVVQHMWKYLVCGPQHALPSLLATYVVSNPPIRPSSLGALNFLTSFLYYL